MLELEYSGEDFAAMDVLARQASPAGSLSGETGGDLGRSPRWDQGLRPLGIGDEAVLACRDALGCWGWIKAHRDSAEQPFAEHDLELFAQVGPGLGGALRRSLARNSRSSAAAPSPQASSSSIAPCTRSAGRPARAPGSTLFRRRGCTPRSGCCRR